MIMKLAILLVILLNARVVKLLAEMVSWKLERNVMMEFTTAILRRMPAE